MPEGGERLEALVRDVVSEHLAEQNAWLREEWELARKERTELRSILQEAPNGVRLLEVEEARAALQRVDDLLRSIRDAIVRDAGKVSGLGLLGLDLLS